jgi:hypothetical protein
LRSEGLPVPQQRGTATADLLGLIRNRYYATTAVPAPTVPRRSERPEADERTRRAEALFDEAIRIAQGRAAPDERSSAVSLIATAIAPGNPERARRLLRDAEADARAVDDEYIGVQRLMSVAIELASIDPDRCEQLAAESEGIALAMNHPAGSLAIHVALMYRWIAGRMATTDPERAERVVRAITNVLVRPEALADVAAATAAVDPRRAERLSGMIEDARPRSQATATVAAALPSHERDRSRMLFDAAEADARAIDNDTDPVFALLGIACLTAPVDRERAARLIHEAETTVFEDERTMQHLRYTIFGALMLIDLRRAERTALALTSPVYRPLALVQLATAVADTDPERFTRLAAEAEACAGEPNAQNSVAAALATVAPERAERLIEKSRGQLGSASVAIGMAVTDPRRAEEIARTITDDVSRASALAGIARKLLETPRVPHPMLMATHTAATPLTFGRPARRRPTATRPRRPAHGGRVIAWGENGAGQTAVPAGLTDVVAIAAGWSHSLALRADGHVVIWGHSDYFVPARLPDGLVDIVAISASPELSLALDGDGRVTAWGKAEHGQTSVPDRLADVVAIAAGLRHCLALHADGHLTAWGDNGVKQAEVPAGLADVVAIAADSSHSLALTADGHVIAWGRNQFGQASVPDGLADVVAIATGDRHSLALHADGHVTAWGDDQFGQASVPAGLADVVAIAAGPFHNLALRSDGFLTAWGFNDDGQTRIPPALGDVVALSAGISHSVALIR